MAIASGIECGSTRVRNPGGEDYATPPRAHQDQEESSGDDSVNPVPGPGAGVGSMGEEKSPQTVISMGALWYTPLDPE